MATANGRCLVDSVWRRSSATRLLLALTLAVQGGTIRGYESCHTQRCYENSQASGFVGRNNDASEQGVEADEAWQTSELRSLTPVFDGLS